MIVQQLTLSSFSSVGLRVARGDLHGDGALNHVPHSATRPACATAVHVIHQMSKFHEHVSKLRDAAAQLGDTRRAVRDRDQTITGGRAAILAYRGHSLAIPVVHRRGKEKGASLETSLACWKPFFNWCITHHALKLTVLVCMSKLAWCEVTRLVLAVEAQLFIAGRVTSSEIWNIVTFLLCV